jgi:gliding motility-associated-like protein
MIPNPFLRLVVAMLFLVTAGHAQIISNFSSSSDGWTCIEQGGTTVSPAYNASGGNPGGFLSEDFFTTTVPNSALWFWLAPSKFLGNRSLSYNQTLSFDLQQSQNGTDMNIAGDVVLTNAAEGYNLYFQLPTRPSTASWSSYSITLNETAGWKKGNLSGPAPSKDEMKRTLVNVTSLKIRAKFMAAITGSYIAKLDNVVMGVASVGTPPSITSFSPKNGLAGTSVTITGSNFNANASQNAVYFSGVRATITNATSTQIVVKVPAGAPQGPITVVNMGNGLQASTTLQFYSRYDNNQDFGGRIIPSSMSVANQNVLPMSNSWNSFGSLAMGDFDVDGKIDLVTSETGTKKAFVYRALGTPVPVSASSFAAPVTLPGQVDGEVIVADFDGDGLLDIAGLLQGATNEFFNIFRNTSTVGNISFAAPVSVMMPNYAAYVIFTEDLDNDGRVELISTNGSSGSQVWINQNLSTPGNIDFAGSLSYGATNAYSHFASGDLNNDGKKELIVSYYNSNQFLVFNNTSTPGSINLPSSFTITPDVASITDTRLILADFDADAKPDLAWVGYGSQNLYVKKNQYATGALDASAFSNDIVYTGTIDHPTHLAAGDINSDGFADVVVVGFSDMAIYQHTGSATLNATTFNSGVLFEGAAGGDAIYATGPCIADFDGDNKPEVIMGYSNGSVSAASKAIFIYRNECFPPPQITSLSKTSGDASTSFNIIGKYLNTHNDVPQSRVEGVVTATSAVSNTSVTTVAPVGYGERRVGITLHNLSAFAPLPFTTTFSSSKMIDNTTFAGSIDFPLSVTSARDGLAVADYDNDGKPDVIIDDNFTGKILRNTQAAAGAAINSSTLTALSNSLTFAYKCKASDLDGDGLIDIIANGSIYRSTTGSQATPISFANSVFVSANSVNRINPGHDLNLDGKPDIIFSSGSQVGIAENYTRKGNFSYSSPFYSFEPSAVMMNMGGNVVDVAAADFDGDGFEDLAMGVAGASPSLTVMLNTGTRKKISTTQFASPVTFASGANPQYVAIADFDGDGKMDIAVGNNGSAFISVYRNVSTMGNASFQKTDIPSSTGVVGIVADDLDGDGLAEMITIHQVGSNGSFAVFQNKSVTGNLSFGSAISFTLPGLPNALATADMNLDGKADILIARNGSPNAVLSIFENKISNATLITINKQPGDASVCAGLNASFTTTASGTSNITYQWQFFSVALGDYTDISDGTTYTGTTTSTLTFNTASTNISGNYRCKINGVLAPTVYSNVAKLTINPVPAAPSVTNGQTCKPASIVLQANGGSSGQYRWYTVSSGGTAITGQTQNSYTTPVISITTTYYVSIVNGTCESARTPVDAVVNPLTLAKPLVTTSPASLNGVVTVCNGSSATLTAPSGFLYQWSDNENVQSIEVTNGGSYQVVVSDANGCTSPPSDNITIVINPCDNPPSIDANSLTVALEGRGTLDLLPLLSDPDDNLDLSTLRIVRQPASGARASIDAAHMLILDYTGVEFAGEESVTIEVCDLTNRCAQQTITVDIAGDIVVYGGLSPNGDEKNPVFFIQYIDVLEDTKDNHVTIFNRWGDIVFDVANYDNVNHVFRGQNNNGADLTAGTYFYKIEFASGKKTRTGYISLKR